MPEGPSSDKENQNNITHIAVNNFAHLMATSSFNGEICIHDLSEAECISQLCQLPKHHDGPVYHVSWAHPFTSSDCTYLASCGVDKKVIIWRHDAHVKHIDPSQPDKSLSVFKSGWEPEFIYDGFSSSVNSVEFAPYQYGTCLAAVGSQKKMVIITKMGEKWTVEEIEENVPLGSLCLAWAPATAAGSIIEMEENRAIVCPRFATGGLDNILRIWHFNSADNTWKLEQSLAEHSDWIRAVSWCPLMSNGNLSQLAAGLNSGQVVLWNCNISTQEWSVEVLRSGKSNSTRDCVTNIDWSECGSMLCIAYQNRKSAILERKMDNSWQVIVSKA